MSVDTNRKAEKEIQDFITKTVGLIVENPEDVKTEILRDGEIVIYKIKTEETDIGRVIGKGGSTINTIRQLCRIMATMRGIRIIIKLRENA